MNYKAEIAKLSGWINNNRFIAEELQKILVAVPAVGPESEGDGEWEKGEALCRWFSEKGIMPAGRADADDSRVSSGKRPNFWFSLEGENTVKRVWIMSHLDVVPAGDMSLWTNDPYKAVKKGGRIYGRGTEDNHHGIILSVLVFLAYFHTGIRPPFSINILFISDEEYKSKYGIIHLIKKKKIFAEGDLFLVPDGGEKSGIIIETAEKSLLWLKFRVKGKQCHASVPEEGVNSLVASSALVLALGRLNEIFPEKNGLFSPPNCTFVPTKKEQNLENINTVPGEDIFYMDCRILPDISFDDVAAEVLKICRETEKKYGVRISVDSMDSMKSGATDPDSIMIVSLKKALKHTRNTEGRAGGYGGSTVAAHLRNAGYPAVVWSTVEERAHMPDEYCCIDNIINDAATAAAFIIFLGQ